MSTRNPEKRADTARPVGTFGRPDDAARALLGALPDLSPEETGSVFEELARICGVDLGRDEKAWSAWIDKHQVGQDVRAAERSDPPDGQLPPSPEVLSGLLRIAAEHETADEDQGGNGARNLLCKAPAGPFRQEVPGTVPPLPLVEGYELLAKIGEGGMGTVYKAQQLSLKRTVAIKILQDKFAGDKAFIARFTREARLAAALTHPNVVRAVDAGVCGGLYYFAMEYVDGETVKAILEREGLLPERRAAEIALQIARALEYARTQGLIHRDVKPDNILIDREGAAMLADMGLARVAEGISEGATRITRVATMMGTPDYISPEQARCQEDIDTRTDVYALGATLFHMATGRPPFTGESQADVISKHLNEPPPRAPGRGASLVIRKAMEKARGDRYRTPGEMASDLEDVLRGEAPRIVSAARGAGTGDSSGAPDTGAREHFPGRPRRSDPPPCRGGGAGGQHRGRAAAEAGEDGETRLGREVRRGRRRPRRGDRRVRTGAPCRRRRVGEAARGRSPSARGAGRGACGRRTSLRGGGLEGLPGDVPRGPCARPRPGEGTVCAYCRARILRFP